MTTNEEHHARRLAETRQTDKGELTTNSIVHSLVASPMWPIGNPEMLSNSTNFYDGNVIYIVWKDKLA